MSEEIKKIVSEISLEKAETVEEITRELDLAQKICKECDTLVYSLSKKLAKTVDARPFVLKTLTLEGIRDAILEKFAGIEQGWSFEFTKGVEFGEECLCVRVECKLERTTINWLPLFRENPWKTDGSQYKEIYHVFYKGQSMFFLTKPSFQTCILN